jgi:hypothetical protein
MRLRAAMAEAILRDIAKGEGTVEVKIFDGEPPSALTPDYATAPLVSMVVSVSESADGSAGVVVLDNIREGRAGAAGVMRWGALVAADGEIVIDAPASLIGDGGFFQFSSLDVREGDVVRLGSLALVVPGESTDTGTP